MSSRAWLRLLLVFVVAAAVAFVFARPTIYGAYDGHDASASTVRIRFHRFEDGRLQGVFGHQPPGTRGSSVDYRDVEGEVGWNGNVTLRELGEPSHVLARIQLRGPEAWGVDEKGQHLELKKAVDLMNDPVVAWPSRWQWVTGERPDPTKAIAVPLLIVFILVLPIVGGAYRIFLKAGEAGWTLFVPVYSQVVLFRIIRRPWWLAIIGSVASALVDRLPVTVLPLEVLPFAVALAVWWIQSEGLAEAFGKSKAFAVGLALLPTIYVPMLGYSEARYRYREDEPVAAPKKKKKKKRATAPEAASPGESASSTDA